MASAAAADTSKNGGVVHSASFGDLNLQGDGVRITVKDLTYQVPSFKDKKVMANLLRDVSGIFNPAGRSGLVLFARNFNHSSGGCSR
jgi:hypothetical protein